MMELLDMGDYGPYVWSCFGMTVLILAFNEWRARQRERIMLRDIKVRIKATEGRQ